MGLAVSTYADAETNKDLSITYERVEEEHLFFNLPNILGDIEKWATQISHSKTP